jgi:hypothetical protein
MVQLLLQIIPVRPGTTWRAQIHNMKQFFLSVILAASSMIVYCQTTIKLEDISKHIGDSVKVCGKVAGGRYVESAQNSPTVLNLGAAYPDQLLTIIIRKEQRSEYKEAPETMFLDKEICVTGTIVLFRERPQIVVYRKEQIKLAQ